MSTALAPQEVRTFSVRVPETLYEEARRVAETRKVSVNALMSEALARLVDEAHDQEMYDAATLLGMDAELCSVDYALNAQAEVVLANA